MYLIEDELGNKYKVEKLSKFCEEKNLTVRLIRYTNPKWKDVEGKRYQEYHKGFKILSEDIESDIVELEEEKIEDMPKYKESHEISQDGTHKSDKLLRMSAEQSKDVNFLLESHGFDIYNWELLSAKNNIWNAYSKQDGIMTMYSSKITVKPKIESFNIDWFKKQFKSIEPIDPHEFKYNSELHTPDSRKVVELGLYDLHLGLQGIDYEDKLREMSDRIINQYRGAETFILPIGQDLLNANVKVGANFTTVKGTSLQQSLSYKDMIQTGIRVISHIIDLILSNTSADIDCIYVPSNHDQHSTFGLFCAIMQRYKDFTHDAMISKRIYFDDSMKSRKYRRYGVNGIAMAHGDKEGNRIYELFQVEAPMIYANTKYREYHLGHLHNESVTSKGGITFRRLPTVNTPDDWHSEMGFVGATNRIQVFVYDLEEGLESINYYNIK